MPLASVDIQNGTSIVKLSFEAGKSTIIVGANGSGKTRLGIHLENSFHNVVRISAQRSLSINDNLSAIGLDRALNGLKYGYADNQNKIGNRWQGNQVTALLNDFEFLLQSLFAEQNRKAVEHLESAPGTPRPVTQLQKLRDTWQRLLPHRNLVFKELSIDVVLNPADDAAIPYKASQMSDGERLIFYMIGHCLMAEKDSVIIIDEPELHVHKAILGSLWDAIEAERPDCSFVYISHDLDFVASRPSAAKYVVNQYMGDFGWDIELLPEDDTLPERVMTEILGSRRPVLFLEGSSSSIDIIIYRAAYIGYMIQPLGSCEAVIHSVSSFNKNKLLHRAGGVFGCIDADARNADEVAHLSKMGVFVLPVAEIENVFLIPSFFIEIAKTLEMDEATANGLLGKISEAVSEMASKGIEAASVRYAVRRLDAHMKKIAPSSKKIEELTSLFNEAVNVVDPSKWADKYKSELQAAIDKKDIGDIARLFDDKGLVDIASKALGFASRKALAEYVGRVISTKRGEAALGALREALPKLS